MGTSMYGQYLPRTQPPSNHMRRCVCARRFLASDALRVVFDFADAQLENAASSYFLASNFPRRVFTAQVCSERSH